MIKKYNKKLNPLIFHCIKKARDKDFFFNKDSKNSFIYTSKDLKKLLQQSTNIYINEQRGEIKGLVLLYDSYLKVVAESPSIANDLFKVFFWNIEKKEIKALISRKSWYYSLFLRNGFKFKENKDNRHLLVRN